MLPSNKSRVCDAAAGYRSPSLSDGERRFSAGLCGRHVFAGWLCSCKQAQFRPGGPLLGNAPSLAGRRGPCFPSFLTSLPPRAAPRGEQGRGPQAWGRHGREKTAPGHTRPPGGAGRLLPSLQQVTLERGAGREPGSGCRLPHPELFEFPRREGNVKTEQHVLDVPWADNAGTLTVRFHEILQREEVAFSGL